MSDPVAIAARAAAHQLEAEAGRRPPGPARLLCHSEMDQADRDRRASGRGHGQRVPDADRHLLGLGGACRGELDPRSGLRGLGPVPWQGPVGQRGIQLIYVCAGDRHASGAQQARGDHLGGLGMVG
jgi:hypothetical protein